MLESLPHFFLYKSNHSYKEKSLERDCRSNIEKVVCLVDPVKDEKNLGDNQQLMKRKCLEGSRNYASYFEKVYDNYPVVLQKVFCSLDRIFIEKEFFGTAFAGVIKNEKGEIVGAKMGIRQSVLHENLELTQWASWKEQLSFGGVKNNYTVQKDLPHVETMATQKVNSFLYFVIAHEFGHILDFTNNLNEVVGDDRKDQIDLPMKEGSFGHLSFETTAKPWPAYNFSSREKLCFYLCKEEHIKKEETAQLYEELYFNTPFLSTYSAIQPWDDFADSLAYFLLHRYLQTPYLLKTGQGEEYDIMEKLQSEKFRSKYQFIDEFLERRDIRYP